MVFTHASERCCAILESFFISVCSLPLTACASLIPSVTCGLQRQKAAVMTCAAGRDSIVEFASIKFYGSHAPRW